MRNKILTNEDAPANAVGSGSGVAGIAGGGPVPGRPSNWNEPGVWKTKYSKDNARDEKEMVRNNPVLAMVKRKTLSEMFHTWVSKKD